MRAIVFTIVARNYLSLALSLGDSLKEFHNDIDFKIFLADGIEGVEIENLQHEVINAVGAVGIDYEDMSFKYNVTEFCTAIKPYVFESILDTCLYDRIVYLDPDMHVFSRLDYILESLQAKAIFVTPHLLKCQSVDSNIYPEYLHLWEGIFNLGLCAINASEISRSFIVWWKNRLQNYCYADKFDGLHTDQKWADYLPVFFGGDLFISRHAGINVAHWNLSERDIDFINGEYFVDNDPLVIFHFSGFEFRNKRLTKHIDDTSLSKINSKLMIQIAEKYHAHVIGREYEKYIKLSYAHSFFTNGAPVLTFHRRLYRKLATENKINHPFYSEGEFYSRLKNCSLLDSSFTNESYFTKKGVSNFENKRRRVELLLRFALKLIGVRKYYILIKAMNIYGRIENHSFLLERK